jgi:hypothetical protein
VLRLLTIAVLVFAIAGVASAATTTSTTPTAPATKVKLTLAQTKLLWATVNICDTDKYPDTIGMAGSMPVIKKANGLYMRFRVQYRDEATNTFKAIPGGDADSEWEIVDPGKGKARQAGHDFTLAAPKKAGYVVRGQISYQWRKGRKVVLSASRFTTALHPKTMAADPKKFSAAICTIK